MLAVAVLVAVLVLFIKRMIHYKTAKNEVEQELKVAHNVWTIGEDEVELQQPVDGDTPGGYGDVYSAFYRAAGSGEEIETGDDE